MPGRPSGTCNGAPCYSAADHAAIAAEKAVAEAELIDLNAQVTVAAATLSTKTAARDAKATQVTALTTEQNYANTNSCP